MRKKYVEKKEKTSQENLKDVSINRCACGDLLVHGENLCLSCQEQADMYADAEYENEFFDYWQEQLDYADEFEDDYFSSQEENYWK